MRFRTCNLCSQDFTDVVRFGKYLLCRTCYLREHKRKTKGYKTRYVRPYMDSCDLKLLKKLDLQRADR